MENKSPLLDKNVEQTKVVMLSVPQLEKLIDEKIQKQQTRFIETFFGQIVLACVTAVATAYVTQKVFGKKD